MRVREKEGGKVCSWVSQGQSVKRFKGGAFCLMF